LRLWRSCTPWRRKLLTRTTKGEPLDIRYQGAYQGAKGAAIRSGRHPRRGHPALRRFPQTTHIAGDLEEK
jgi:hypothetical protein